MRGWGFDTPASENLRNMLRAHLHLIDSRGMPLSSIVQAACELAFKRVLLDYPNFDEAQIANWAEEVALAMNERGDAIQFPKRYAYMALKGKVRDWSRTGAGRAELKGIGPELEKVAGSSESSETQTEREVLFEQILPMLSERDRAILVLLLNEQSTPAVAAFLDTNYAAAAKAIQRVKDRISVVVNGKRHKPAMVPGAGKLCGTRGISSGS
jgi:hypothetical protein